MIGKLFCFHSNAQNFMYFGFIRSALDEFGMFFSWSEKLAWKRKVEAEPYERIIEDPELHYASS